MSVNVGDLILAYIQHGYWDVMEKGDDLIFYFKATYAALLWCSVIIYGVLVMTGGIISSGKELLKTCLWAVIGSSLLDSHLYHALIVAPISEVKTNLAIFMAPGKGDTLFSSVQDSFSGLMGYGMALIDSGSVMTNLMPIIIGGTVMLVCGLYYIAIVANLLFCELALYLLYFLGMFIIPLGAFRTVRPMTVAWVKAVSKYALVFAITGILVGLIDGAMRPLLQEVLNQSYASEDYETASTSIYLACVITLACFGAYLMSKAIEFAAELTGGVMSDGATGIKSISNGVGGSLGAMSALGRGSSKAIEALKKSQAGKLTKLNGIG